MSHASGYVDAGYAIGLSVLFLYGVSLVLRRRRLERSVSLLEEDRTSETAAPPNES
jgi:uncharacterized protein (TIGR03382 family)